LRGGCNLAAMDAEKSAPQREPFRLGPWRVDPDLCQVSDGERKRHVEPRTMAVLVYLASRHGVTVSREQLLDAIWKTRFVVEEALTRCVSQLRQLLDDDARSPRFVQTVPKLGYRLLVRPEPIQAEEAAPTSTVAVAVAAAPTMTVAPTASAAASPALTMRPLPAAAAVLAPERVPKSPPRARRLLPVRRRRAWLIASLIVLAAGSVTWLMLGASQSRDSPRSAEVFPGPAPQHSVAILPFVSMSIDAGDAVFADGMTEEVIQLLARVPRLRVSSRTSSFHFKNRNMDLATIGRQLGVAHVLEGSVRHERGRLRITVQLIDVRNDAHVWSEVFDRELADIFDVQEQIATVIAQKLADSLRPELLIGRRSATQDLVAYQLYIAGRAQERGRTEQSLRASIDLYKSALTRDPQFAAAWAALALSYWVLPGFADVDPSQVAELDALAKSAAQRGVALDDSLGAAHMVLADYEHTRRRTSAAEVHHRRALAAMPGDATLHGGYAAMLSETGRLTEALTHREVAWRLEPLSGSAAFHLARGYLAAGRDDDARRFVRLSRQLGFDSASLDHAEAHLATRAGDFATARALWARRAGSGEGRVMIQVLDALEKRGSLAAARAAIRKLPPWHALPFRGRFYAACMLGDRETALEAAAEGVANGLEATDNWWIPEAVLLRTDARFPELAQRMNFVEYWRSHGWPDGCAAQGASFRCQ
jgi:TolB-like protein/DNA-binding winged helix-turn-helix (wHTH) protein